MYLRYKIQFTNLIEVVIAAHVNTSAYGLDITTYNLAITNTILFVGGTRFIQLDPQAFSGRSVGKRGVGATIGIS